MKKIGCIFLACMLVLSIFTLPAAAADSFTFSTSADGFDYSGFVLQDDGTAVSQTPEDYVQWTIPASAQGMFRAKVYLAQCSRIESVITAGSYQSSVDLYAHSTN